MHECFVLKREPSLASSEFEDVLGVVEDPSVSGASNESND